MTQHKPAHKSASNKPRLRGYTAVSILGLPPPYLPTHLNIAVANNSGNLTEPMLFYLSFARRPDQQPPAQQHPLDHLPPP